MTKKTRRKLPPGQRPRHGAAAGYEQHSPGCQCRQCRRLAGLGRSRNPDMTLRQTIASHLAADQAAGVDPDAQLAEAARDVRVGMQNLNAAIKDIAMAGGKLLGLIDNRRGTTTLASIEADQGYQLMGALADAQVNLADFWIGVGKGLE